MKTELHIIYSLINRLRDAEHNNDERLDERLLRGILRQYRGDALRKYYKNGQTINDEVMQTVTLVLPKLGPKKFRGKLPKIIRLDNHYGFYITKDEIEIPILSSENFSLAQYNHHSKFQPRAKTDGYFLVLYSGEYDACCVEENSRTHQLIVSLSADQTKPTEEYINVKVELRAVLDDPSEADNYDWENDPYPFPAEKTDELITQILVKEFGIMSKAKTDEVQNARQDNIRYHDNDDVTQTG